MGIIGGILGRVILNRFSPPGEPKRGPVEVPCSVFSEDPFPETFPYRLQEFFGEKFCEEIRGKSVADFGCGGGRDVVEMLLRGAAHGVGLEIREEAHERARRRAEFYGVADRCEFRTAAKTPADIVISVDAFEHFGNPEEILRLMAESLKPGGVAWISFGPPWYHPKGGHLFSIFPWAHLFFTEKALIEWRKQYRDDGATRFSEVAGGLNRMSIRRFKKIIRNSPFEIRRFEVCPIKGIRLFDNPITREFLSASVRCRLQLR